MAHPKIAYILRWFPEPSETFIYHEVTRLKEMGVPLKVFMTYGKVKKDLSPEMTRASHSVEKLGIPFFLAVPGAISFWLKRNHGEALRLCRTIPFRRWCDLETAGENMWAFLCGFHLARRFEEEGIEHIHAPWANGPATAAWVASRLTGIPFSFTAHAGDIFPPDGALAEKIDACCFLRTENAANIAHLSRFAGKHTHKIHVIHNGIPTDQPSSARVTMKPPYQILALGRLVPKKGFDVLLRSCGILKEWGVDFHLTLGGSGRCERELKTLANRLGLGKRVFFPGFIPHHQVPEFLCSGDIFVMPSLIDASGDRDGVPTVIMEALFHGLPVTASDVSGIGEIIQDGNTGVLVPQKDPLALASALVKMVGDREMTLAMAGRGRSVVLERFDVGKSCREILNLFNAHGKIPLNSFLLQKRG
jgi:colanic acid/amylovoran biosynthesis glycosyltransferase